MRVKSVTSALLDFWVRSQMNVMFIGRRGVGKTAVVKDCFERNGLKWKYFSAATMDPWCDFVGIPRAVHKDGRDVLEYVMSPDFTDDTVEALFFDEFNRSHKKVRDAVMELIQFKSINGRQFKNLKIVWAAINPVEEDEEKYQVEELDPAVLDRFHVHVNVPYRPDRKFFDEHYGKEGRAAVDWWNEQPDTVQTLISPRRLEYALRAALAGNVSFVFPDKVNSVGFLRAIKSGSMTEVVNEFVKKGDVSGAKKWISNVNNLDTLVSLLKGNKSWWDFYLPLVPEEHMTKAMTTNRSLLKWLVDNESSNKVYTKTLDHFESSTGDRKILKWLRSHRTVVGTSQFGNMLKTMRTSPSTYERFKVIYDLTTLIGPGNSLTKSDDTAIQEIVKVFFIRTQRFTLTQAPTVQIKGLKGTMWNNCKKILDVVGWTDEIRELLKNKGFRI